ncbi:hypothetical protein P2W68_01055 [Chryseobacterium arthrosphaerae]|uniref:hypothetical protein n=1 Tax=Chryseobacterium arthrosphaerae TaxID=651561 RepID=UPI0023E283D4|nr:hypothetical protein [Chryseobacterium arthrosphaerae]WES98214.1 hypothetical protein P2W68_01055 [Chryseobacterium arthrosphaerae]
MKKRTYKTFNNTLATHLFKGCGKLSFLIFVIFFYSLYSQEGFGTSTFISLKSNAEIYSSDSNFNQQLVAQGSTNYRVINFGKGLLFKSKDLIVEKKYSKPKTQPSVQAIGLLSSGKLRKIVSDYEKQKELFNFRHIYSAPFSRELPYSSDSNRSYLLPSTTYKNFSKVFISQYKYLIGLVLEILYVEKYIYINNRSFNFCFSKVFSVRPPPLFIV